MKKYVFFVFILFGLFLTPLYGTGIQWESEPKTGFGGDLGIKWESNLTVTPPAPTSFVCGTSTVQDADGNTYNTVQVGTQCWMASNLNVGTMLANATTDTTDDGVVEKWCYNNSSEICATDGGLYNWYEAMKYSTTEGAQGICPVGWHIPTDAQLYVLENYLKDEGGTCNANRNGDEDCSTAGTKLQSGGTSGMNLQLAGFNFGGEFFFRTVACSYWSSSVNEEGVEEVWDRNLAYENSGLSRSSSNKAFGFSVLCLKD